MDRQLKVKIARKVPVSTYKFNVYFKGFEKIETVRKIFGEKTEEVLSNIKVEFGGFRGYMGVSPIDGHLLVSAVYLKDGDMVDIYLDIIHELVHVKQFMEGKELFDNTFRYTDRPSEIEAYRITVDEARKLGLSDERICEYLKTEWMSDDDFTCLAKILNVRCSRS